MSIELVTAIACGYLIGSIPFGLIASRLSGRVDLRVFPRLRFHWDPTPENADRVEKALAELREKKKA